MTGRPSDLADLLAECAARGIRLIVAGDDELTVDGPRDSVTPDLLAQLKANKAELLALLRPAPPAVRIVDPWDSPRRPTPTPRLPAGSPLPPKCEQHAPPVMRPTLGGPRPFCPACGRNLRPHGIDPWASLN